MTDENDYITKVTKKILDADWVDSFSKEDFKTPNDEETRNIGKYEGNEIIVAHLRLGKGIIKRTKLNVVGEYGLQCTGELVPYSSSMKTGLVAVFSGDLELVYSVVDF
jgi:hypothetical protein